MDRTLQRSLEQDPIAQQAAEWFVELQANDPLIERIAAWQQWLAADERHRIAFEQVQSVWNAVDEITMPLWPRAEELSKDEYDGASLIADWRTAPGSGSTTPDAPAPAAAGRADAPRPASATLPHRGRRLYQGLAIAATLAAVATGVTVFPGVQRLFVPSSLVATTRVGESRTLLLADGSRVALGGHSSIAVHVTPKRREIELESGEAFFSVAKDRTRPFMVRAGTTAVTAVGTAFNVRRGGDNVVVAVAEGVVEVDAAAAHAPPADATAAGVESAVNRARLTAGQQLNIEGAGTAIARSAIDASTVGSWREGTLHYIDEPLERVIADVQRYSDRDIEIADPAIGKLRVTGTVFEQDVDSWLRTLESAFPLRVSTTDAGKVQLLPVLERLPEEPGL